MRLIRVYTGDDGESHFESLNPVDSEEYTKGLPAASCAIREMAPGTVMDWHPAPGRQIVFHLTGRLEIGLRDGSAHIFGPGTARLMDDVTGSGHLTRVVGDEPVVQAIIRLAESG